MLGVWTFFLLHLFFLKLSFKFLYLLYNFHFPSVNFLCSIAFCWYISLYYIFTFLFLLTFKNTLSLFSFSSFGFHRFLNSYFLSCPGKCTSRATLRYNLSPTTLPWCDEILGCWVLNYVSWPEETTLKSWISSYLLNYKVRKYWNYTTARFIPHFNCNI